MSSKYHKCEILLLYSGGCRVALSMVYWGEMTLDPFQIHPVPGGVSIDTTESP